MPNVVSNPLFQVILLFVFTSGVWFLVTDGTIDFKKKIFTFVTDALYYFVLVNFGLNLLLNFQEILREPYRILLVSSDISWLALLVVLIYLSFRENKKKHLIAKRQEPFINQALNYFLLLGLFNHLFYYYKYSSVNSVIFMLAYFLLYLLKDRINYSRINELTLLLLGLLHAFVMFRFSKIIIYYQIVFYPYQIISLFFVASILVAYFRRDFSSKQK